MPWVWELPDWPKFVYDPALIIDLERAFLQSAGGAQAVLKHYSDEEQTEFIVEVLSLEGLTSSAIEGEYLERDSLQSSIRKHFGLQENRQRIGRKEQGMAALLNSVYQTFDAPLSHETLCAWHQQLMAGNEAIDDIGSYRSHPEPMQIVSRRFGVERVFYEAPPSEFVHREMEAFVQWFNRPCETEPILCRAALVHLYFESIHPFEDGNGRIGRALVEKALSQSLGYRALLATSAVIEEQRKQYYMELEKCNQTLNASDWVVFFANLVLTAQQQSMELLHFLLFKAQLLQRLKGQLNPRQEKVLLRLFAEGPKGFRGGLSAENYISISKTSRATAGRDLVDLVEKGALVKTGKLRHTRYWLPIDSSF